MNFSNYLNIQPEIAEALKQKKPVVALESTIIAHGMPYPRNVQTAVEVESIVRENGAIPATIALLEGKLCVGLNKEQLEYLGTAKEVWKVSLRDMPYVISKKIAGATTVAATMRVASMAGISVFVTGGIGGVHREAQNTMDISADLTEMQQTSVAVVSAGVKSILDIGLTLEYLETLGVPVVTYGQATFPSFYSRESAFQSPLQLDSAAEIASLLKTKWELGLNGSVLIANPIPQEHEVPFAIIEKYIHSALMEAKKNNVNGKNVTPFILRYIANETKGESLTANIALVKSNAKLGAQIACAFI
ncbi:MAG: pseudouridine-5'-phosphate glycosidase [Bacteroidetes bacterium]|nr:pseudouridine-5'-phosphate glycosidase [Bacteroidota bacterium]MBK9671070.1 pseudouridine-5'-phosphate glycosidase [Bacteroidota bacterium]MBK9798221.1 pseudouridine-5'-phosphate glycosidase [Bacteroidota bacterium]MBP6414103.1 pseudouridine-5'-phosphate glycosidase [Bacteroidia bacterium]